ncbi:MAG: tRNA 2-thiouridine(34) synthase MnmA [Candidatus Phytoplasma stylosanthis]|uniref:tRNA 2-thiouridine(34) synthase MnmA n=1 Tax=Candidatus Phytoplasma stylosanthis TaxID=2798314 RepID=UPI00293A9C81|nr:tRNA 2-thiouridine(34) synthase MnmA [Candidatus Phytoplasma stylosanthis]MDV3167930.1 tRNA 2-thiouridine(34) synthase MnmA [Candidatus Phytoplasma stylosanthis]MDV3170765.1 tRNA 2-thiouridine(34) synthase MnmA [Candidatus Phytoplasma stylosanthis]MDV3174023.1 tRNA 2-thiouridine(34) synthase MnmA [Candidatus Phytoplasma stylosanthis]MDV3202746.1 tRNA 2-thiouridine(34) synthase MnmA [Candidatus Phytoplasma stylosanthis]
MKKRVIIGLSGGVDSSVSAFLLKKQGYDVEGIFMRNWDSSLNYDIEGNPYLKNNICPQERDYEDALKVAEQLNIKCHKVDFSEVYWDKVFSVFLDDLKKNLTPNPDVLCNNKIKFLTFIEYAKKFNPDYIAMGHYAQIIRKENKIILAQAIDKNKDQTYFLSQLKTEQLEKVIFPLGMITKKEVREIAFKEKLITAQKKDSTGICFIGERNFFSFLNNYLPIVKGPIKDINGTFLKEHEGVIKYTIGQRKGLNLKVTKENQSPWFVIGKDLKTNTLYVDQNKNSFYLYSDSCLVSNVVWRDKEYYQKNVRILLYARFRYRQPLQKVEIKFIDENRIKVYYPQKIKLVTPGQICAFYKDNFCLGAGIIKKVYSNKNEMLYS